MLKMAHYRNVLFLCLFSLLASCAHLTDFEEPQVELLSIEPIASNGEGPRFRVNLKVMNPNNDPLTISGVYYDLELNGHKLISGANNAVTEVPAYGEAKLQLEGGLSLFKVLQLAGSLMTGGDKPQFDYALHAKISVKELFVPIRLERTGKLDSGFLKGR